MHDLVVIGGGTAGLVGAQIAAAMGARVALIERDRTGGDCLWTGCVPSKALLAAGDLAHRMRHADRVGLAPHEPAIDFASVMAHVRGAQATIAPMDSPERLRAHGVEVIEAVACFTGPDTIDAGGRRLRFRRALLATGSEPAVPPVDGLEAARPLTSDTVWELDSLPGRLLVLGGGPIGCELGQGFGRLGARVTLVEADDRLLPREEPEASRLIAGRLRGEGVDLRLGVRLEAVEPGENGTGVAVLSDGTRAPFDRLLVATGRRPRTEGIGLEAAGIELDDGGSVRTDARLRTTSRRVYAAGDVAGELPFTHVAAYHARVAVPNALLGLRRKVEHAGIPWVTFTDPEVARIGPTAAEARERWGDDALVADAGEEHRDRIVTAGEEPGFVRLVGDSDGRLRGATVAAPAGGEAIAEMAAWIASGAKVDAISQTVHAYPTFAEGPARAADEVLRRRYGRPALRRTSSAVLAALRAGSRLRVALGR